MADILSLEKARQRRRIVKRILFWLAIFLLVVGLFLIYVNRDQLRNFDAGVLLGEKGGDASFPVDLPSSNSYRMLSTSSKLLLLTDTHLYVYNKAGKLLTSYQHGLNNPSAALSEVSCVLYERGTSGYAVMTLNTLRTETYQTSGTVASVSCSDDGQLCVIESGTRYVSELIVYNVRQTEVYRWQTQELVTAVDFAGRNTLAAISLDASGGELVSKISVIPLNQEEFLASMTFPGNLLLSLDCKDGGQIVAIGDQAAVSITQDGKLLATYDYGGDGISYCDNSGEAIVLVLGDYVSYKTNDVVVLDAGLNELGRRESDKEALSLSTRGYEAVVLFENGLLRWDGQTFAYQACAYGNLEAALFSGEIVLRTSSQLCLLS